jgi:HAL2 family 3'(2'),5'-bisphosphate nucleotidase
VTAAVASLDGLPNSPRAAERDLAIAAVRDAARLCRSVREAFGSGSVVAKEDRSPVTVADLGAQALIRLTLAAALPSDPLMGEEDGRPLRDAGLAAEVVGRVGALRPGVTTGEVVEALDACSDAGGPNRRWWTLDPVDGTKGYLRDEQYAIALALIEDGEVVLGVLGCPNLPAETGTGCLFVSVRGAGAWQLPLDRPGSSQRIGVAPVTDAREARTTESVEAGHSAQDVTRRIAERLGLSASPLRLDSQAKYAVVARGDASIYLRVPHGDYRENVWDHAAGSVIVEEAGGCVSDVEGRPLDFTQGSRLERNRGIVATAAPIHDRVVRAAREELGTAA